MLFEVEAFDDLLDSLEPTIRRQLQALVLEFRILGGSMASDQIKKWNQEENLRKIFQTAPEFLCRGKTADYFFKNEYVAANFTPATYSFLKQQITFLRTNMLLG
jgi:hypothetical protein